MTQQVMIGDVVELFLEDVFWLFPFVKVVDLSVSWQVLVGLLELIFITHYLRVDEDSSRNFELDREHLATFSKGPDLHYTWLKGFTDLHDVPV